MENYHERYNFTQDYIEATANKYKDKIKKGVDFIQFDAHSLTDCVNNIADRHAVDLKKHEKEIEKHFPEMSFYCDTEYNSILLAGYGSKYDFLQKFATQHLSNYPIIAVNGFVNGLTVKYILNKFCAFLKQNTDSGLNRMNEEDPKEMRTGKLSQRIEAQLEYMRSILNDPESDLKYDRVIFMVHSIDGKSLRNMEIQHTLSTIAAMKRVTLIASMDNYMYQTILSPQTLENFNFRVFYVDTFAPYKREFQYLEDTNQKGNKKGADALKYIFKSFTSNQKEIVKTLARHMYENSNLEGIEFKQLFKLCFDHAMISSEAQLKENLLEVLDHKVIKEIKGERGRILYTMEFPRHVLEQIVEDKFE